MKRLLCWLGLHEFVQITSAILPYGPYASDQLMTNLDYNRWRQCKRCGKVRNV